MKCTVKCIDQCVSLLFSNLSGTATVTNCLAKEGSDADYNVYAGPIHDAPKSSSFLEIALDPCGLPAYLLRNSMIYCGIIV